MFLQFDGVAMIATAVVTIITSLLLLEDWSKRFWRFKRDKAYNLSPAVYPRLVEFLHFDIQSTGQKSHCVNIVSDPRNALF